MVELASELVILTFADAVTALAASNACLAQACPEAASVSRDQEPEAARAFDTTAVGECAQLSIVAFSKL
ncbi:MAG: hypothetical protein FJW88_14950 [Actinobacteria bacterium]|nr:hypothetical protein [Actinomycetota bacterium]